MDIKTLSEYRPYILGEKHLESTKEVVRVDTSLLNGMLQYIANDNIAKQALDMCETPNDFFDLTTDLKHLIPKEKRAELFYTAKLGEYSLMVPSMCIYMLRKAYATVKIPNLIFKVLPKQAISTFFEDGYLMGGLNLRDVICSCVVPDYTPLGEDCLRNKIGNYTEIYVRATDMVAVVPNHIADALTDEMILNIELTRDGLVVGSRPLRTMAGHYGIVNSNYDLRAVI